MLVRALLQTSLVLWLAQQTLQGGVGVKPQSVSWGRVLPARGVGIGVKPGVAGALGALGSRYGSKAMRTGIGRYPGAQLGVGGYRALGLGGRAGLKQATPGAYGASLGPGMALGAGHTNGLGLGLGQGGKRVYGAGLGALPGYGALAGIGYPGARPGVSAADLGGPELASLSQAVQHLKREKSTALGFLNGNRDRTLVPEMPVGRGIVLGPSTPVLQAEVKSLDPVVKSSSLGSTIPLEASRIQRGESYDPTVLKTKSTASHGATLPAGGVQQQLPLKKNNIIRQISASSQVQSARDHDSTIQQSQQAQNYRSTGDLSDILEINCRERLGSETQGTQSLVPQPQVSKDSKLGHATPQGQKTYPLPRSQTHDVRSHISSRPLGQGTRNYLYAVTDREGVKDLGLAAKDRNGLRIRGTIAVEKRTRGSLNLQVEGRGGYGQVFPGTGGSQGLDIASVERQEARGFTAGGQEAKHLLHAEWDVTEPKALNIPGQTGRNNQATSYIGGAGSYLGAPLGAAGYGTGLGQGAYLGGAAGKLGAAAAALGQGGYPQGAAGISNGYGEGATGYLGAVAGNGFGGDGGAKALSAGYGNGYSDGYGAGLGNPAELADGAENKAGKREALSTGGYAGQVQGAYGALGTGLESTGGKYGGAAAQVPYGNAPVIPTGLEGDGGYPYSAQHLSLGAEGAKTTNKYGAGVGYGAQQTGYGAQLGVTQDGLGEPAGKYGGVNAALGNGYKG